MKLLHSTHTYAKWQKLTYNVFEAIYLAIPFFNSERLIPFLGFRSLDLTQYLNDYDAAIILKEHNKYSLSCFHAQLAA
jgi:hypothetical protein